MSLFFLCLGEMTVPVQATTSVHIYQASRRYVLDDSSLEFSR